jgi:hypothetical protein
MTGQCPAVFILLKMRNDAQRPFGPFDISTRSGVPSAKDMKTPAAITLLVALAVATFAQDSPNTPPSTNAPSRPTQNPPARVLNVAPSGKPRQEIEVLAPERPKESEEVNTNLFPKMPQGPTVSYGGLASDIKKSTNRWKMFSLRQPANVKRDEANVIRNTRTEGGPAVKIFSVDF